MNLTKSCAALTLLFFGALQLQAAITVPGADGSDLDLNVTADTVIDLSQAVTGSWNASSMNPGRGIYDPSKWAVVFKYSNVTVAAGKTLTFINHPSRAPVVWLVNGNVNINGTVSLDGRTVGVNAPLLAEPGPGGFRGGQGYYADGVGAGAGFGVGGGQRGVPGVAAGAASYGTVGNGGPAVYGNPAIIPLIGGSGGGAYPVSGLGGSGGGGAILIACANSVSVAGTIQANGGVCQFAGPGSGSGGAIRVVSDSLAGGGSVKCLGGAAQYVGGLGRIRIERVNNNNTITVTPDPSVISLSLGDTAVLWPPNGAPEVKIVSIGGQNIGPDPLASFGTYGADAVLPQTTSTQVLIETTNVEQASQLKVRGTLRSNGGYTEVNAAVSSVVSTTPLVIRWTATLPVQVGYAAVQVKVIRP